MAGHGGGAWKVAYADFVTAMMAFFMVMWITAQNKQMKMAVAHYFNDPFNSKSKSRGPNQAGSVTTGPNAPGSACLLPSNMPGEPPGVVRTKATPKAMVRRFNEPGAKPWTGEGAKTGGVGKPTLLILHNGDRSTVGTIVRFGGTSCELDSAAQEDLKYIVPLLLGKRQKIEIRGHAPHGPPVPGEKNRDPWELSYARCVSTMKYLIAAGVEPDRFRLSQAAGFEPHTIHNDPTARSKNSCVDVYVLNELAEDSVGSREERAQLIKEP